MKKTLQLMIALFTFAFASAQITVDDISYTIIKSVAGGDDTNEVEISGSSLATVVVPSTISDGGIDYTVTATGTNAFNPGINAATIVETIELPITVTSIGEASFRDAVTLTNVSFTGGVSGVTNLSLRSFLNCSSLTNLDALLATLQTTGANGTNGNGALNGSNLTGAITLPSLTAVNGTSFLRANHNLTSVDLSGSTSLTILNGNFLFDCDLVNSVLLPEGLITIGGSGLRDLPALPSLTIPSSVTTISANAMTDDPLLKTITVLGEVPPTVDAGAFGGTTDITTATLVVPVGTLSTYQAAAVWQDFGTIVEMVDVVEQSVGDVFTVGDLSYTVTNLDPKEVEVTGFSADPVADITIPSSVINTGNVNNVVAIGENAFHEIPVTSVVLPSTVVTIKSRAFRKSGLTTINLENVITLADKDAFSECKLTGVDLSKVTYIGRFTFNANGSLPSIEIPVAETIADGAFRRCIFTEIIIPSSVTTIGANIFNEVNSLKSIQLEWESGSIVDVSANDIFIGIVDPKLITVYVPTGSTASYVGTGWDAATIVEGTIPAPVGDPIGTVYTVDDINYTITDTDNLEVEVSGSTLANVTIPASITQGGLTYSVTAVGLNAFGGDVVPSLSDVVQGININNTLVSVVLPSSVTLIKKDAFTRCQNLESINLENVVTIDTQNVFFDCPKLTTVNLESATNIGNFTFHGLGNSSITSINIPNAVVIGKSAFRTTQITTINIPASVTTIEDQVFRDCTALTEVVVNWTTAEEIPSILSTVFQNLTPAGITLVVPTGTESLYGAVTGWQDLNIEGFVDTVGDVECVEEAESNRIATLDNGSWSQSFTPSCSGTINGITFSSAQAVGAATLVVGTGNNCAEEGSTILTTKSLSNIVIDDNLVAIDDVSVVAGTVYYFKVTTDGDETFQINFNNGNPYAGGFLTTHTDGSDKSLCDRAFTSFDWKFKVEISDNLSVGDIEENQILIYPNPVVSDFTITNSKGASVMIYDILGKLVIDTKIQTNEESVNVSGLNSGIYNVRISNNGTISSQKLIKR